MNAKLLKISKCLCQDKGGKQKWVSFLDVVTHAWNYSAQETEAGKFP